MPTTETRKAKKMCEKFVTAVEKSKNSKTGEVSATYAPIQSCPEHCPFLDHGCYAQNGNTQFTLSRLNTNAKKYKSERPVDIARAEAKAIDGLSGSLPLRLHIVGDCKTARAAEIVARAAEAHIAKHGQPVWTYTHSWREIPREKWGKVSVLASCETIDECKQAMKRGYAASIVRLKPFEFPFSWKGVSMVPCKELTKGVKCDKCRVCMNDKSIRENKKVICFFPHGSRANEAKEVIRRKDR